MLCMIFHIRDILRRYNVTMIDYVCQYLSNFFFFLLVWVRSSKRLIAYKSIAVISQVISYPSPTSVANLYFLEDNEIRCNIPIGRLGLWYNTTVHLGHCYPDYDTGSSHFWIQRHLQGPASDDEDTGISKTDMYDQTG